MKETTDPAPPGAMAATPVAAKIKSCNELLRNKLREMREATGSIWSNSKFATKLGVSSAVISQYLNDAGCKYDGDVKGLEVRIDDFLRNEERRRASGIETTWSDASEQMKAAFEYIRRTNDIGAIVAESGEGKTRGIELIREEHPLALLFTVRAWSCDKNSVQSALWDCIPHVGYDSQQKRAAFMCTSLRGSDRPLIVDDAHKLTRPALHWLFDFYDETNIPIALIGTIDLIDKLEDDSQRFSRVGVHMPIKTRWNSKEGIKTGKDLIRKMVKTLAPDSNGDTGELIDLCEQVARQHGHFRSVHKQLKLAAELKSKHHWTWPQSFRNAHELLLRQYKLT